MHAKTPKLSAQLYTGGQFSTAHRARSTRLKTLSILTKDGELVFAPHFPFPGIGHIEAAGDAFAWKPSASTD
jgi:hypothetical protein